mmetsp:Transcript_39859/g.109704  ORF Transcript_39859/g.109704 Transcript_39859/m.109704 type:complete len:130 (+) Transcript_39859:69-458(+)
MMARRTSFFELPWCGPFWASPKHCLDEGREELLGAAHYSAHAAGMIPRFTTKLWMQTAASRNAEAADNIQKTLDELKRFKSLTSSVGPTCLLVSLAPPRQHHIRPPLRAQEHASRYKLRGTLRGSDEFL